jgi:uncharacterized protein YdaU (DUF1376 family)
MTREEKAQYCIDNPKKTPAFQFYPDNWWGSRHVAAMDIEQRGIHACLLFSAWLEDNCGIPENEICLTARISEDKKNIALIVLNSCWFLYNNFWFNERLLNEKIKQIELSIIRKTSGDQGGRPSKSKTYKGKPIGYQMDSKQKAKITKSEDEIEIEKEDENTNESEINSSLPNSWKTKFWEYKKLVIIAYREIINTPETLKRMQELNPGIDIPLSLQKSIYQFWGRKAGWENKKKAARGKPDYEPDMKMTLIKNLDKNKVWMPKQQPQKFGRQEISNEVLFQQAQNFLERHKNEPE